MSFKCDLCGEAQEDGTKPVRIVLERRHHVYYDTAGSEIVKEVNACADCVEKRDN